MAAQLAVNGIIAGAVVLLLASSFVLIFTTVRFFHFAHGVVFTAGAYFTFLLSTWAGVPVIPSALLAVLLSGALGSLMELAIYRPLRHKGASSLVLLLCSLGLYVILQNVISVVFGDDVQTIRAEVVREGINVAGARVTLVQMLTVAVSVVLVTGLLLFLRKTPLGRTIRAVANDAELASVSGIDSDRVILWAFAIGSALAGVAGILVALDVDMTPTMGLNALMMGVVAVIIGGANSIPGIALGALLLGMAQQFGVWWISSQWQDAIAFIILLAFLLFRPQGFMGRKVKKAVV